MNIFFNLNLGNNLLIIILKVFIIKILSIYYFMKIYLNNIILFFSSALNATLSRSFSAESSAPERSGVGEDGAENESAAACC